MPKSERTCPSRGRTWRKKLAFSLATTLGFFLLLELGLRVTGVQPVTDTRDPFEGFSQIPLLVPIEGENGEQLVTTASSKLVWFNAQTFPKQKPAGTRRVFCVGGSTTYGRPYWDTTSYSGWLRELLPLVDDSCDWEVVNAGGVSYASYRVAVVMEELAQYEPDLFIVYSVHNEFLERRTYAGMFEAPLRTRLSSTLSQTRTWALLDRLIKQPANVEPRSASEMPPEEVDEILNHTVGPANYHRDDQWRADVLKHYELNLARMVKIAKQAGSQIVFVTPASNEKDCSPFKSEATQDLSAAQANQFQALLDQATDALANKRFDAALASLTQARTIDDGHAMLHYQMGKALFALDRTEEAREAFNRALNSDVCPLRALPDIRDTVRRVANRERTPIVDFAAKLKARCRREFGHECLGDEYFLDHVHPTIDIHQQLALWIIETLQHEAIIGGNTPSPNIIETVANRIDSRIDKRAQGISLRNLAKVLHWAGKFDEAAPRAADALTLIADDLESQFLLAECLRQMKRDDESMMQFERLFELDPDYARGYIPFGTLLAQQGHLTAAKVYLSMAVYLYPKRDDAFHTLGAVHLRLGEYEFAKQSLLEANTLNPNDPSTLLLLAKAKVALGEAEEAIAIFEQALASNPNDADGHNELGETLARLGRREAAAARFLAALSADPEHEDAQFNLETIRRDIGL
ncbi:MAG: tetratricopeptide repeat protein [Planctomycetales bacterium]|nr:tetratricopeptide repeat protein [Planctomycetales bacterium]